MVFLMVLTLATTITPVLLLDFFRLVTIEWESTFKNILDHRGTEDTEKNHILFVRRRRDEQNKTLCSLCLCG